MEDLDCEMGDRLNNIGIKSKQIRHRSACLHLYHDRPYKNNISIRKKIVKLDKKRTANKSTSYFIWD